MLVGHKLLADSFKSLVQSEQLAHGYLFFGSDGVGKRLFALSLANFLSSGGGSAFGGELIDGKILNDAFLIQPNENKAIGIDAVREIKNFLYQRPNMSSRRTVIIDEAEFLTTEAQNALLKITEEPPASSLLILIARDPEVLMPTLASRLQKVYFSGLKFREVEEWLVKEHSVSKTEAEHLARGSFGSPGLALKLFKNSDFLNLKKQAEKFLKTKGVDKKDFIKNLLEPENFDVLAFLDAVILQITNRVRMYELDKLPKQEKEIELWHRALKLRRDISNFPLNPRLQLEALLNHE